MIMNTYIRWIMLGSIIYVGTASGKETDNFWDIVLNLSEQKSLAVKLENYQSLPIVNSVTSSGYGMIMHPIHKIRKMHNGMDIPAEKGTPFHVVASGYVETVGNASGLGKTIVIKHDDDIVTRYSHASSFAVNVGDFVKTNEVIGFVGNSGLTTGYHLHFEVEKRGDLVDPMKFVVKHRNLVTIQP